MFRAAFLIVACLVALPIQAQTGQRVLDQWLLDWETAYASVQQIRMTERAERELEGPRGVTLIRLEARIVLTPGERVSRDVRRANVSGEAVTPEQLERVEGRAARALGRHGRTAFRPPVLPGHLLRDAVVTEYASVREEDRPLVRLQLQLGRHRVPATAWFEEKPGGPELRRLGFERSTRERGSFSRVTSYERFSGLDLPTTLRAGLEARQQRRTRSYAVELRSSAVYTDHAVTR